MKICPVCKQGPLAVEWEATDEFPITYWCNTCHSPVEEDEVLYESELPEGEEI